MERPEDPLQETRASLIRRLKNLDDQTSWRDFFDLYWKLVYGVARKSGLNDAEAQDVVQETMAAMARNLPQFDYDPKVGSFKGWLLTQARWCIINHLRKRPPQATPAPHPAEEERRTSVIDQLVDPASQDLDRLWDREWESTLLEAATAKVKRQIDPEMYQVFDCYVNKEWPPQRVAEAFSTSVENVYVIKHRVTALLKTEVERLAREGR